MTIFGLAINNTKVIDSAKNWNLLLNEEALHIKRRDCVLNNDFKSKQRIINQFSLKKH